MPRGTHDATFDRLERLAARKGMRVEPASVRGCWRLITADGETLADEGGSIAFTSERAKEVILKFPNRSA